MMNSILVITSITTTIILIYQDDGCQLNAQRLLGPTFAVLSAFTLRLPDLDNFQVLALYCKQNNFKSLYLYLCLVALYLYLVT